MITATDYWFEHQVGGPYANQEESLAALRARAQLYPTLHDFMPTEYPGQRCLDYGCGPGHDTLLMLIHGAAEVVYADVSPLALDITTDRIAMHGFGTYAYPVRLLAGDLKVEQGLFDHVHLAGVLHHASDPISILRTIRRVLAPRGDVAVMVYDGEFSQHSQSEVPVTHWFTRADMYGMASAAGLTAILVGRYRCDADWRPNCLAGCYRMRHQQ